MKLNGNKNIIFDSDIITTNGEHLGESLDATLNSYDGDISELKRNVKFLYQYGGIGSKGGGGGGSSEEWSIYATLNKVQLNSNYIYLDGIGSYNLQIKINKPNGISYRVSYSFKNSYGQQEPSTVTLNLDNMYSMSRTIYLDMNDSIIVTVISEDGDTKQVSANFITQPYTFNLYFADEKDQRYLTSNNDLFISDIQNRGLCAYLDYNIGIQGTVRYRYYNFNNELSEYQNLDISDDSKSGKEKLQLADSSFFINDNAGYYTVRIDIELQPVGQQSFTVTRVINCNLIPSNLYLKLTPQIENAILYDSDTQEDPYSFSLGNNTFIVQPFEGQNQDRQYEIDTIVTNSLGESISFSTIYVKERSQYSHTFMISNIGWNKITLILRRGNLSYIVEKYIYIKQDLNNLEWEYFSTNKNNLVYQYYVNSNGQTQEFEQVFSSDRQLIQSLSETEKQVTFTRPNDNSTIHDTLISFAIQYGSINEVTNPILKISDGNNANLISVYQNKITIGQSSINIFIPKYDQLDSRDSNKFNLITIYKKFYKTIGTQNYYEILIYVDGVLEGALPKFSTTEIYYNSVTFNKINFICNLFDIKYYSSHKEIINNVEQEVSTFKDSDITRYYYVYLSKYNKTPISDLNDLVKINNCLDSFQIDTLYGEENTRMVSLPESALKNLCTVESLDPVLVFDISDTKDYDSANEGDTENFVKWYQRTVDANTDDSTFIDVAVSYKPKGSTTLQKIETPSDAQFYIEKQGTSTREWFAKNLNLGLRSSSVNNIYLFTPNLQTITGGETDEQLKEKSNTFLPEQKFTLKKDVVDSGHSNNNAIADFVNRNTKKFETGENEHPYSYYIKNCLTGFPCLVFVRVQYTSQGRTTQNIYYLGIYNFNLGRDSYYNLGYKSLYNISSETHTLQNGFQIYSISRDQDSIFKSGLEVAEVLDNLEYYDFSQYDQSILFGADSDDKQHMFGKLVYSSELESNIKNHIKNFVKGISAAGGYVFDQLHKNYGPIAQKYNEVLKDENNNFISSKNQVPDYRQQYERVFDQERNDHFYRLLDVVVQDSTENNLINAILGDTSQETIVLPLINYRSLVEYYVIIMAFGMFDSIEKNLNIKSWNSGNTFYTAFYDMDTSLGLDNGGQEVSYFAFSDYWDLLDGTILNKATIYRDFFLTQSNNNTSNLRGFDTPSSYLFAIAKYAKLVLRNNTDFTEIFPLSYWATLRAHNGELRNAKYFMNNYYSNRTANIGEGLLNLNYRATYLLKPTQDSKITEGYESRNFEKFHGSRKYYTEHWLSERLHIIDVYMGLVSTGDVNRYVQYLDLADNKWKTIMDSGTPLKEVDILAEQRPKSNDDIIVYKDIFGATRKYSETISVYIKALENSFVIVSIAGTETTQYMIKDPNTLYNLVLTFNGPNNTTIGGSDRWTYISDLAPFISSSSASFTINSTNLQNFYLGQSGALNSTVGGYMPAVRKIDIHGRNYTFKLQDINTIFPNVLDIDINNSSVSLNVQNSNVKNIIANNVNSESLEISNCNYLEFLNIDNSVFSDILSIAPYNGDLSLTNVNCRKIDIIAKGENRTAIIRNNTLLENIRLNGFTNVEISGCTKLQSVELSTDVKSLKITNCSGDQSVQSFKLHSIGNDSSEYDVDLNNFTTNKLSINFNNTKKFSTVKLPDNCQLQAYCFNQTAVKSVDSDGYVYITGNAVFRSSQIQDIDCIRITETVTDLSDTFNVINSPGVANLLSIQNFLNNIPDNNSVTDIPYMFAGQSKLTYTYNNNTKNEYNNQTCSINLDKFKKVTNARGLFTRSGVSFLNKYMFKDIGIENSNQEHYVNLNGIFKWKTTALTCTIDSLEYILPKLENTLMITTGTPGGNAGNIASNSITTKIKLVSTNSEETPKIREFLRAGTNITDCKRITSIYGLQFEEEYDYNELFSDSNANIYWDNLQIICYCFNKININNFASLGTHTLPELKYVYRSFNDLRLNEYIDLYNVVLDWSKFQINSANILPEEIYRYYETENRLFYECFNAATGYTIKKVITKEHYDTIWNNINCTYYKIIGNLFENTLLISNNNNAINIPDINSNITETLRTFGQFEIINVLVNNQSDYDRLNDSNKIPINLDNFITNIKNCKVFEETFQNITLYKTLPYDFFKRRYELSNTCFYSDDVNNENSYQDAIYYSYQYTNDITSLKRCFYNVRINGKPYFDPNDFTLPEKNRVICNNEEKEYYIISKLTKTVLYPEENTELSEINHMKVSHYYNYNYNAGFENLVIPQIGDLLLGDIDNIFFIAPDLLYACKSDCDLTECFMQSDFSGGLPKYMIKTLKEGAILNDWLYQTNILPQYVGTYLHSGDSIITTLSNKRKKVYVFVPEQFGKNISNYNKAFTFYQRLPKKFLGEDEEITSYYIFLDSTFKLLQSMKESLPVYLSPYDRERNSPVINGTQRNMYNYRNPGDIYYNIMFNTSLVNESSDTTVDGISGLDGISYSNMDIDDLFTKVYTNIGFGYLFSNITKPLREYSRTSNKPAIYFLGNLGQLYIIVPQSVSNENQTINSYIDIHSRDGWVTTKLNSNYMLGQFKDKYKISADIEISNS